MKERFATIAVLLFAAIGCRPIPIDVSHASTDKGYLNSGLRELGQLYLLDTADGSLDELAVLNLTNQRRGAVFEEQLARNVRGVDIGGEINTGIEARVDTQIALNSYIRLTNAFDESYTETFSDLSAEINRRDAAGEEVGFSWFLDEAINPSSSLRYLLVYSTIRADTAVIGYSNVTAVDGGMTVPFRGAGNVDVSISGLSEESWRGKAVPVLVDYHVIQASLNEKGNYAFRIDRQFSDDDLADVLKRRGLTPPEPEVDPEIATQLR